MRLWLPANILGLGLYGASRKTDSPLLFPVFIASTAMLVHGIRLATGTSVDAARAAGWLMAEAVGEPATALVRSLNPAYATLPKRHVFPPRLVAARSAHAP